MKNWVVLNERSIDLARALHGLLLICEFTSRLFQFDPFFSHNGFQGLTALSQYYAQFAAPTPWSVLLNSFHMNGDFIWKLEFLLAIALACFFIVRRFALVAGLLLFPLLSLINARFPFLMTGWESHMVWTTVVLSLATATSSKSAPNLLRVLTTYALAIHLITIYTVAGWSKTGLSWSNGSAVINVLSSTLVGRFQDVDLEWLSQFSGVLSSATIFIEGILPWFLLLSTRPVFQAVSITFLLFHSLIGAGVHLGLMAFALPTLWLACLNSQAMKIHESDLSPKTGYLLKWGPLTLALAYLTCGQLQTVWSQLTAGRISDTMIANSHQQIGLKHIGFMHYSPEAYGFRRWPHVYMNTQKGDWFELDTQSLNAHKLVENEASPIPYNYENRLGNRKWQRLYVKVMDRPSRKTLYEQLISYEFGRVFCERFISSDPKTIYLSFRRAGKLWSTSEDLRSVISHSCQ